jgi:hypothetical protein
MTASLRIFQAEDAPVPVSAGHAQIPKWITELQNSELNACAKTVLAALVGLCFGESVSCYPTVKELSGKSGMAPRSVQRALSTLTAFGLIARTLDPSKPGTPWKTTILFERSGRHRRTDRLPETDQGPRQFCHPPTPILSPPHANSVTPHQPHKYARKQGFLEFDKKTTTIGTEPSSSFSTALERISDQAGSLFPEVKSDTSLLDREITEHGIEKVALALELGQFLAGDSKRKPRIFRWLHGTLANWSQRSTESIRAEIAAVKGARPAPPVSHRAPPPQSVSEPAGTIMTLWQQIKRGEIELAEAALAEEKAGCGQSAKITPQPAGASEPLSPIVHYESNCSEIAGSIGENCSSAARPVGFEPTTFGFEVCGANISSRDGQNRPGSPKTAPLSSNPGHSELDSTQKAEKPSAFQSEGFSVLGLTGGDDCLSPERPEGQHDA